MAGINELHMENQHRHAEVSVLVPFVLSTSANELTISACVSVTMPYSWNISKGRMFEIGTFEKCSCIIPNHWSCPPLYNPKLFLSGFALIVLLNSLAHCSLIDCDERPRLRLMILAFSSVSRLGDRSTQNRNLCPFLPWFLVSGFFSPPWLFFLSVSSVIVLLCLFSSSSSSLIILLHHLFLFRSPSNMFLSSDINGVMLPFSHHELYSFSPFCSFILCRPLVISFSTSPNNDDNDVSRIVWTCPGENAQTYIGLGS